MMDVLTVAGEVKSQVELPDSVFGQQGRPSLLWEAVRMYLANQRQGNAKTKTRGEVSGTGRKPWKQKSTGRARHGSRRSPIFVGGGVNFGPRPRDYGFDLPKKKRRQALRTALSARLAEGGVKVIEDFELSAPKTKELVQVLSGLGLTKSTLLLVGPGGENLNRASRNVPWLAVLPAVQVNTYQVLKYKHVVFTEGGLKNFLASGTN